MNHVESTGWLPGRRTNALTALAVASVALHAGGLALLQHAGVPVRADSPRVWVRKIETPSMVRPATPTRDAAPLRADTDVRPPKAAPERRALHQEPPAILAAFVPSEYVPVESLAERPIPAGDIIIPYPEDADGPGRIDVVLVLYINELGAVDRVRAEGTTAPVVFVETAKRAFEAAIFSPPVGDAGPRKALMRIVVSFDSGER